MKFILVCLKPFRHNLLLKRVLQPKIAKITENPYFGGSRSLILMSAERVYKICY